MRERASERKSDNVKFARYGWPFMHVKVGMLCTFGKERW